MIWPFSRKDNPERDVRVTSLDEEARTGEISLVDKILELDRKRVDLDRLTADALKDLGRPHRA
jgi:uncharacterized protein YjiS (DUF1127 family)